MLSEITAGQLAAAGSDATYTPVPGAGHLILLPEVASRLPGRTDALLDG